jgi:hypothetical protein
MLREVNGDGYYKYYIAHSKTVLSKKYKDIVNLYNRDADKIEEKNWPKFKKHLAGMSAEEYAALRVLTASVPNFMKSVAHDLNKRRSKPKPKSGSDPRAGGTQVDDPNKSDDQPPDNQPPDDGAAKKLEEALKRAEEAEATVTRLENEKVAATTERRLDAITGVLQREGIEVPGEVVQFGTVGQN